MSNFSTARANFQDNAAHAAQAAGDVLRDKAHQAGEALKDGAHRAEQEGRAAARRVGDRVSERPLTSLAATLAIGAIAGYLIGRR